VEQRLNGLRENNNFIIRVKLFVTIILYINIIQSSYHLSQLDCSTINNINNIITNNDFTMVLIFPSSNKKNHKAKHLYNLISYKIRLTSVRPV
jgi:hypothetical protein